METMSTGGKAADCIIVFEINKAYRALLEFALTSTTGGERADFLGLQSLIWSQSPMGGDGAPPCLRVCTLHLAEILLSKLLPMAESERECHTHRINDDPEVADHLPENDEIGAGTHREACWRVLNHLCEPEAANNGPKSEEDEQHVP